MCKITHFFPIGKIHTAKIPKVSAVVGYQSAGRDSQ